MRATFAISGLYTALLLACSSPKPGQESVHPPVDTSAVVEVAQREKPTETVLAFLYWYRHHLDTLATIPLVKNNPPSDDTTKFYAVDFEAVEHYLAELKQSGFVSDQYLQSQREYFKKADENFTQNKQNDGPPDNFDVDLVMRSQDMDDDLANSSQASVLKQKSEGNSVSLVLSFKSGSQLQYGLTKKGDRYLIDAIDFASEK